MNSKDDKNIPVAAKAMAGKKKKARALLLLFLKKLKGKCGTFKKAEEWEKLIKENLTPILNNFESVIPSEWQERINSASKLKDSTKNAIDFACKSLQKDIKGLIKFLPKRGIFANPLVKFVLGVAVGGGIIVTVLNTIAVTVTIKNQGCETIYPTANSFVKIPGLKLPDAPIANGGTGVAKLPPITFSVDFSDNKVNFKTLGINLNFRLDSAGIDLVFDGQSLIGKSTTINLKEKREYELVASCR